MHGSPGNTGPCETAKQLKPINEKKATTNGLTKEKLKTYKGFENSSEAELAEDLIFIKTIAQVLADIYQRENNHHHEKP